MNPEIQQALRLFNLSPPLQNKEEIKKKYRELAMEYHPDRNRGSKKSEEKFKLIGKHKDILMKNFHILNTTYAEIEEEEEQLEKTYWSYDGTKKTNDNTEKQEENIHQKSRTFFGRYIGYYIKRLQLFIKKVMNFFFNYVVLFPFNFLVITFFYFVLFFIPILFYGEEHSNIFEKNYVESGYITDRENIWDFQGNHIRNLGTYDEEYTNHKRTIYPIEKLKERENLLWRIFFKGLGIYVVVVVLYTIIYHKYLKKNLKPKIESIFGDNRKELVLTSSIDEIYRSNTIIEKKTFFRNVKESILYNQKVHYFLGLYIAFWTVTKVILFIF